MKRNVEEKKKELLRELERINEQLKVLESRFKTTSLLKVHFIEKTMYEGLILKRKRVMKKSGVYPNSFMIQWIQATLLEINEDYNNLKNSMSNLKEFLPNIHTEISKIGEMCFMCHTHLDALEKKNLSYFNEFITSGGEITLHKVERFIEESFYDLRIKKEELLSNLREECRILEVDTNF